MQRAALVLACALACGAGAADATVIFDRPAADPFTAGTFFSDVSRPREAATAFQLEQAAEIQGVAWRGGYFDPTTPPASVAFVIHFFDDASGAPADVPFYSAELLADVTPLPGPVVQFSYRATLPGALSLPGGVPLWISIAESDPATSAVFTWRKSSETGTSYSRADASSAWQAFPGTAGLELDGLVAATPEPTPAVLLGFGMLGLGARARLRRRSEGASSA